MNILMEMITAFVPVFVAATTAYGAVLVAKVQKMQKYITTNHGTSGLGDATDKILEKVESISDQQDEILLAIAALNSRNTALEDRIRVIENTRSRVLRHVGLEPNPVEVPPVINKKLWRRRI